jgi:CRP-like cAMP-binding protein
MTNAFIDKLCGYGKLDTGDIGALEAATADPRKFVAKQDLIREGDPPGPVFVVLEGWLCRYKMLPTGTRQITAFMIPGDACDLHVRMLDVMDHSIQAITASRVAMIPRQTMQELMDRRGISDAMYIAQLVDQGTLRAWIVSMGRRTSTQRVAHLMCELYLRAQSVGLSTSTGLAMPLSQQVLADALGMTSVHINRVLKVLREERAMDLHRGSLSILDPTRLVQIAGFDENYLHRRMSQAA